MSRQVDEQPLVSLLSAVTQLQREALVSRIAARGFSGVLLPGVRLLAELRDGAKSVQTLADATATTKQYSAREVQKLETSGYVSSQRSKADKRVTLVALTSKGRRLLEVVKQVKRELDGEVARRLGAANAQQLRGLLRRLLE